MLPLDETRPPFVVRSEGELIFIGDAQRRCLLLTDARATLALALLVLGRIQDESRHLRSPHVWEFVRLVPRQDGSVHLVRLDAEAFLQQDAPVVTDAEVTLTPEWAAVFVQALLAHVPPGTRTDARPANDLWSAA